LPSPLWFFCLLGAQLTATLLTTLVEASVTDLASLAGGRILLMAYAFSVDLGAAIGPLMAYSLIEFIGIDAVYLITSRCSLFF
jgi:hypothetical protein